MPCKSQLYFINSCKMQMIQAKRITLSPHTDKSQTNYHITLSHHIYKSHYQSYYGITQSHHTNKSHPYVTLSITLIYRTITSHYQSHITLSHHTNKSQHHVTLAITIINHTIKRYHITLSITRRTLVSFSFSLTTRHAPN